MFKKPKPKTRKDASAALKIQNELKDKESEILKRRDEDDSIDPKNTRRRELRKLAIEIEKEFVPETSTLDRELKGYMHEWNDRIGKHLTSPILPKWVSLLCHLGLFVILEL